MAMGLMGLGAAALVARVVLVGASVGSNDMRTWLDFAERIRATSIGHLYDSEPLFNHPPLMGLFAEGAYWMSTWCGLRFEWLFKAPMVLADLGSALLLYRTYKPQSEVRAACAFALFCCNPASILITAYHGNTDSLCASLMLLAAVLMDAKRVVGSGLALAASINVKLVPVLLIVPLLACIQDRKQALRFLGALSLGALPFVPFLLGHWTGFYRHALKYRSHAGVFGVTFITEQIAGLSHLGAAGRALTRFWKAKGTLLVLLWPVLLAVLHRYKRPEWNARQLAASTMLAFLVFAPGFGIQYLVYPAGLLFAVSLGNGAWFAAVAGLHTFIMYASLWTGGLPYYSEFRNGQPLGAQVISLMTWVVAGRILFDLMQRPRPERAIGPTAPRKVSAP